MMRCAFECTAWAKTRVGQGDSDSFAQEREGSLKDGHTESYIAIQRMCEKVSA